MTSLGKGFCPSCGTARVAGMSFCPGCGLNLAELDEAAASGSSQATATGEAIGSTGPANTAQSPTVDPERGSWPSDVASSGTTGASADRGSRVPPLLIVGVIVVAGLIVLGLLPRLQLGGGPGLGGQPAPGAASVVPASLIVGLSILSPVDGQAVVTKEVVVIGLAPPGLTVTQDISFGLDQHTTVDGTGHWAIKVGLNEGDNKLTFRIGDDNSTRQTIRVIYTPPQTPST
jgi:hypothetical protein